MNILDPETEELLKEILDNASNYPNILIAKFKNISHEEDTRLRAKIKLLVDDGYISKLQWADNLPYKGRIEQKGYCYFKLKEQEETRDFNAWEKLLYKLYSKAILRNDFSLITIRPTNDERITLQKLQDLNLIHNVRHIGMIDICCDLTYDGIHYFEKRKELIENKVHRPEQKSSVFISHSSEDKDFVIRFSQFLELLGVKRENIFCSSIEGQGVSHGEKIEEAIRNEIIEDKALIYIISNNFMRSPYCLNELGAGWILTDKRTQGKDIFLIKLSDIDFKEIKGFVNASNIITVLNAESMTTFVEEFEGVLDLPCKKATEYRNRVDAFIKGIS